MTEPLQFFPVLYCPLCRRQMYGYCTDDMEFIYDHQLSVVSCPNNGKRYRIPPITIQAEVIEDLPAAAEYSHQMKASNPVSIRNFLAGGSDAA